MSTQFEMFTKDELVESRKIKADLMKRRKARREKRETPPFIEFHDLRTGRYERVEWANY